MRTTGLILLLACFASSIITQDVDMSITLTQTDVTTFPLTSLFTKVGSGYSYNVSHPAAFIQTFNEVDVRKNELLLLDQFGIDAWLYQTGKNILYYLANNNICIAQYDDTTFTFSNNVCVPAKKPEELFKCSGLKFTNNWVAVGCLNTDPKATTKTFDVMPFINGAFAERSTTTIPILGGSPIQGSMRIEGPDSGTVILIYDESFVSSGTDKSSIYVLIYDDTNNVFVYNNLLTTVENNALKSIFEFAWIIEEGEIYSTVSLIDSKSGFLELNKCLFTNVGCATETDYCFQGCTELGISKLGVKKGRGRLLTNNNYVIFNQNDDSKPTIHHCIQSPDTQKFDDCLATIRSLPFGLSSSNVVATSITGYSGNMAVHFTNKVTGSRFSAFSLYRYQATGTMAVGFQDSFFPTQIAALPLETNLLLSVLPQVIHTVKPIDQTGYYLQIKAQDLPVPTNSNVNLKRALIYVTQTDSKSVSIVKKISVTVLDKMNSVMGFTDQLPDFGGILGGSQFTNMDRTWIYGNNLQFSLSGSSINADKSTIFDKEQIQYNFSPEVQLSKVYGISISQLIVQTTPDETQKSFVHWFACTTDPNERVVKNCVSKFNFALDAGFNLVKAFPTTSFPDTNQATAIVLILMDASGNTKIHYLWKADTTKNVPLVLADGTTFRDVHVINYKDTLMLFTAPLSRNTDQVDVYTAPNNPEQLVEKEITFFRSIKLSDINLPVVGGAPNKIKSCGHNQYVVEFLSGNGYIVKLNVNGASKASDIQLRANVRIVHPFGAFTPVDFCPFGDEFMVWNSDFSTIFSVSTLNDNSYYEYKLSEFGLGQVYAVTCAQISGIASVWGATASNNKGVATIYGNQYNAAHSKIHSVIPSSVGTIDYYHTPNLAPGVIGNFFIEAEALTSWIYSLGGPYVYAKYNDDITDPNVALVLESGDQKRTMTKQVNIQRVNFDVRLERIANVTIEKGAINLEKSTNIIGHVQKVSINVPAALTDKITLDTRTKLITSVSASNGPITFIHLLDSKNGCTLYLGQDTTTKNIMFSVRGKDSCNKDHDTGVKMFTAVDGRVEDNQAVVATITRNGGLYTTTVYYVKYQGTNVAVSDSEDRGLITTVKVVSVPSDTVTHAVFVGARGLNRFQVLKFSRDSSAVAYWDSIPNTYNVWPVAFSEAGVVLFSGYRSTTVSAYVLASSNVAKGSIQQVTFDGSNNEFRSVKCTSPAAKTITCAMITYTSNVVLLTGTFNGMFVIQDGYKTSSGESGSYTNVDIIPGWAVLQGEEGNIDLYSTSATQQGYLYARIPVNSAVNLRNKYDAKLGESLVHDQFFNTFALAPNAKDNARPTIVSLVPGKTSNDAAQLNTYQIQPLTLNWNTDDNNDQTLKSVSISLGGGATPVSFTLAQFIEPVAPKPDPEPKPESKGIKWYWIMLIVLVILGIIGGIAFVVKNKQRGAEEGAYYDKDEPIVEEKGAAKKRESDDFN